MLEMLTSLHRQAVFDVYAIILVILNSLHIPRAFDGKVVELMYRDGIALIIVSVS